MISKYHGVDMFTWRMRYEFKPWRCDFVINFIQTKIKQKSRIKLRFDIESEFRRIKYNKLSYLHIDKKKLPANIFYQWEHWYQGINRWTFLYWNKVWCILKFFVYKISFNFQEIEYSQCFFYVVFKKKE